MSENPVGALLHFAFNKNPHRGERPSREAEARRPMLRVAGKAGKRARKRCRAQVEPCQTFILGSCNNADDPLESRRLALPCCESLAACDAESMLECLLAGFL
jgi:hypothetical protein